MTNELNYNNIQDVLKNITGDYKILEETVDLEVQKNFYESSKNLQFDITADEIDFLIAYLSSNDQQIEESKKVLQKLAMVDSVKAFRAIESYLENPLPELRDWATLALQQSRMIIQSSLLDEQQVFISTGLGGKVDKLRYMLIFPYKISDEVGTIQQSVLEKELNFFLDKINGELEEISFDEKFASAIALIPLKADVSSMINDLLVECNQFGDFLSDDAIITNIKKFSSEEILNILKKYETQD